jgi:glycosyltransferase involved in cell wall biosynthesis
MPYAPPWSEGVRNLIRRMAYDFTSRGAQVTVIGLETPMAITCGDAGERVINVPAPPKWLRRGILSRGWQTAIAWTILRRVPELDVVLLVASVSSVLGLRTALLKVGSRKPLVAYITGLGRPRAGYRWGLSADRVLVGNEFLQEWFPDADVLYPFLPLNVTRDGASLGRRDDTFNVLFLGSFQPERGVEYLLQAMALVKERTERRIRLIIAWNGGGANNYENIQRLIETLGIRPIVDLRGRVNTSLLYREADMLVIPRASQERMAFPVRIVEALHMRKPIVVSRICGMENLVEGCGLAVEPRDADALAQAILNLVHDEPLRKQLEANCAQVAKRFDSRASLDKLFNELRAVADND